VVHAKGCLTALKPLQRLSLAQLVELTSVPASTIHHYRRAGLIPPPARVAPNRFCYDDRHLEALRLIRRLRQDRGLSLAEVEALLPELVTDPDGTPPEDAGGPDARTRILDASTVAFRTLNYHEVTVGDVAASAGVAKGRVYRYFDSKEELFEAVVERLLDRTSAGFAAAVDELGGPAGIEDDPDRAAAVFAGLVADAMPILLELGARAAKGHDPSGDLARHVLQTLAEVVGRPLAPQDPVPAGLRIIDRAFAQLLSWAVSPDWDMPVAVEPVRPLGGGQ
jgi:AcrR family transcriptional regulator